jgi:hypothetical protein
MLPRRGDFLRCRDARRAGRLECHLQRRRPFFALRLGVLDHPLAVDQPRLKRANRLQPLALP